MNSLMKLFVALHVRVFRATGGRIGGSMGGANLLLLTTTGNKSGQPRTVPVMYLEHDGQRVVVASAAGSPTHPAWFKNLTAKPDVTVEARGEKYAARAEVVSGDERARIWSRLTAQSPRWSEYQKKAGAREIPLVTLKQTSA